MKTTQSKGSLVLGVWLVLTGITPFLTIAIPYRTTTMPLLALIAGVLIRINRQSALRAPAAGRPGLPPN